MGALLFFLPFPSYCCVLHLEAHWCKCKAIFLGNGVLAISARSVWLSCLLVWSSLERS